MFQGRDGSRVLKQRIFFSVCILTVYCIVYFYHFYVGVHLLNVKE
jgi:hypothetical protein